MIEQVHSLVNTVIAHKDTFVQMGTVIAGIGAGFVTLASLALQVLPAPGEKAPGFYKLVYGAIHAIALNKKG